MFKIFNLEILSTYLFKLRLRLSQAETDRVFPAVILLATVSVGAVRNGYCQSVAAGIHSYGVQAVGSACDSRVRNQRETWQRNDPMRPCRWNWQYSMSRPLRSDHKRESLEVEVTSGKRASERCAKIKVSTINAGTKIDVKVYIGSRVVHQDRDHIAVQIVRGVRINLQIESQVESVVVFGFS